MNENQKKALTNAFDYIVEGATRGKQLVEAGSGYPEVATIAEGVVELAGMIRGSIFSAAAANMLLNKAEVVRTRFKTRGPGPALAKAEPKAGRFIIEVLMENDAMLTVEDVAAALETTANKIRDYANPPTRGEQGRVMDRNGNSAGTWGFR